MRDYSAVGLFLILVSLNSMALAYQNIEDFESCNLNDYSFEGTGDSSYIEVINSDSYEGSCSLSVQSAGTASNRVVSESGLSSYPSEGDIISWRTNLKQLETAGAYQSRFRVILGDSVNSGGFAVWYNEESESLELKRDPSTVLDSAPVEWESHTNEWLITKVIWRTGSISVEIENHEGDKIAKVSSNYDPDNENYLGFFITSNTAGDSNALFDNLEAYPSFSGGDGSQSNPYKITDCQELQSMQYDKDEHYQLSNNIDCSDTDSWNSGEGFKPIGSDGDPFTGSLNGGGYVVEDLYIDLARRHVGLIGTYNSEHEIANIGLENVDINGEESTGGIIGAVSNGTVSNSFSTGNILGTNNVGGIAGGVYRQNGLVVDSYSKVDIQGTGNDIGGLIGDLANNANVVTSYSKGEVSGGSSTGGLIGSNEGGSVTDSYWNIDTSGLSISDGGDGLTTSQMTYPDASDNLGGFDFSSNWIELSTKNNDYPFQRVFCGKTFTCNEPSISGVDVQAERSSGDSIIDVEYSIDSSADLDKCTLEAFEGGSNSKTYNSNTGSNPCIFTISETDLAEWSAGDTIDLELNATDNNGYSASETASSSFIKPRLNLEYSGFLFNFDRPYDGIVLSEAGTDLFGFDVLGNYSKQYSVEASSGSNIDVSFQGYGGGPTDLSSKQRFLMNLEGSNPGFTTLNLTLTDESTGVKKRQKFEVRVREYRSGSREVPGMTALQILIVSLMAFILKVGYVRR